MDYLPLFFSLRERLVVVIGGGSVAARKIRLLLRTNAQITVFDANPGSEVAALAQSDALTLINSTYRR